MSSSPASLSAAVRQLFRTPSASSPLLPSSADSSPAAGVALPRAATAEAAVALAPPGPESHPAASGGKASPRRSRLKIWQLEDKFHCPVVGTCLPMEELAVMARRFGFAANRDNEFSLHVEAVSAARHKNAFAEALQKYLDRRYQQEIRTLSQCADKAAMENFWQSALQAGQVAGSFWALLTHPQTGKDLQDRAHGDVHMLSHQLGAGQTADVRRLEALQTQNRQLQEELQQLRKEGDCREAFWQKKQALALESAREAWERQHQSALEALQKQLEGYTSGLVMVETGRKLAAMTELNEQLLGQLNRAGKQLEALAAARETIQHLQDEVDALRSARDALESLLTLETENADCSGDCVACETAPVEKRVLCVGGRTPLLSQYRRLAQKLGVRLVHHDGGQEESLHRLPDLIKGADVVICPTDCVSHPAYYRLKDQCKRQGKPCLLFKGAGVSSFAAALMQAARTSDTPLAHPITPILPV